MTSKSRQIVVVAFTFSCFSSFITNTGPLSFYNARLNKTDCIVVIEVECRLRLYRTKIFSSYQKAFLQRLYQDGPQNLINILKMERKMLCIGSS